MESPHHAHPCSIMVYFNRSQRIFCCQATKPEQRVIIRLNYQSYIILLNTCMHWNTCTYPYKPSYSHTMAFSSCRATHTHVVWWTSLIESGLLQAEQVMEELSPLWLSLPDIDMKIFICFRDSNEAGNQSYAFWTDNTSISAWTDLLGSALFYSGVCINISLVWLCIEFLDVCGLKFGIWNVVFQWWAVRQLVIQWVLWLME